MSITNETELAGMKQVSYAVAHTLLRMKEYAQVGMTTKELDNYGAQILREFGAKSAPFLTYGFPGWTCISVGHEFCHGIPSSQRILKEGDLVNIDVSAELDGYWADNACSFVLGKDMEGHQKLVDASKDILYRTIMRIKGGVRISDLGLFMQTEATKKGYKVIKNLAGHGVGRSLHEEPDNLLNYRDRYDHRRFKKGSVVAVETFISTTSTYADTQDDGWTMVGDRGGYMAQHEHTILITESRPIILTEMNGI